jgi:HK97 family phage major capsid protein
MLDGEIKTLLEQQGAAFDAFKKSHDEELAEIKKGIKDPVLMDRMGKIEKSLDAAVEGKTALEAKLKAEVKEREDLELRLSKLGRVGGDEKKAADVADFRNLIQTVAAERKRAAPDMDEKAYDDYRQAQSKFLREGKEALNGEEVKTLSVGSDPDGGYFVTPDITGRIVNKIYETSPMRQIASVQVIGTDALEGIEDLGEAGAGYAGESAQGLDTTTPQVGKWRIPVYWLDTEPKATQQVLDDANVDIEGWLAGKVGNKLGRFENAEFVAGSTGRIRGLTSYTFAADSGSGVTWGSVGYVATGVSADFAASVKGDKLFDVMGTLKSDYLPAAQWMTNRNIITQIRKFKDGQNNYLWQPSFVAGQPETIMGFGVVRAEDMPALAANSYSLAFGDFRTAYQIVDRQGIRVLRDMYTSKPFVKFYTTKRTGGGIVNFEAVKFLKFGTS